MEHAYFKCDYAARAWYYNCSVPVIYLVSIFTFKIKCMDYFFRDGYFITKKSAFSWILSQSSVFCKLQSCTFWKTRMLMWKNTWNCWCKFKKRHQQCKMAVLHLSLHGKPAQCFAVPCVLCYMTDTCTQPPEHLQKHADAERDAWRLKKVEFIWCGASRYALLFINKMT